MARTLLSMKDKKVVRLIQILEKELESNDYELSDFILQEVAMDHLNKKGWNIRYHNGFLRCKKGEETWGGKTAEATT